MFERFRSWLHAVLLLALLLLACKDEPSRPARDAGEAMNASTQGGSSTGGAGKAGPRDMEGGYEDAGGTSPDAGDQEPQPFAPGSFSAAHAAEITKDCAQTVRCDAQNGREYPFDAMQACLEDTALALERGGESKQRRYLTEFERCSSRVVCEYVDCAAMRVGD